MDIQLAPVQFLTCPGSKLILNHSRLIGTIKTTLKNTFKVSDLLSVNTCIWEL